MFRNLHVVELVGWVDQAESRLLTSVEEQFSPLRDSEMTVKPRQSPNRQKSLALLVPRSFISTTARRPV